MVKYSLRVQYFSAKWRPGGAGPPNVNLGPLISRKTTVEASNFIFGTQLGFGTNLPKTTFRTKIDGVWAKGVFKKNLGPPIMSETHARARKLKLKTQLDVVKYSLRVQNFSARWRTVGAVPGTGFIPDFCISVG